MIKTLAAQIKQYKKSTLLTPLFTILEVVMEVLIPFVTASIIDKGINGNDGAGDLPKVFIYGGVMLVMAFMSLAFGVLAGKFATNASAGFACATQCSRISRHSRSQTSTSSALPDLSHV